MKANLLILLLCALGTSAAFGQSASLSRSKPGETVWVIMNPFKANKRVQYERFIHEIFWPGASRLSKEEQKIFRQTRILHPTKAEADGTYAYFFLMDPKIEGADYGIHSLLKKMYGEPKATEYYKLYQDATAGPQKQYVETQSKD
jgi:hypothetical protein